MKIHRLKVRGFRGFNEEELIDLSDPLVVFEGPNGSGKTSMGEAVEWLLYGKTLKRSKGDVLSRREYTGCYKNIHFIGPGPPFVEVEIEDTLGINHKIRRDLKADESSELKVDGQPASDLVMFGIDTMYDRPLILQHTLQDFIFMKPKSRYEVLSAMLGLEPLIAFRNAVETARVEFGKSLPPRVREAESQRTLLLKELRLEPVLVPVARLIDAGKLVEAKKYLEQVAQGLVASGENAGLLAGLRTTKAVKERAQLDWGRFSSFVIGTPSDSPAIRQLTGLSARVAKLREHLAAAAANSGTVKPAREQDPNRRQFYQLGLRFLNPVRPAGCPFCEADSLTAQRIAAIREAVEASPAGLSAIQQCLTEVRALGTDIMSQASEVRKILPSVPASEDLGKIGAVGGDAATAFLASSSALSEQIRVFDETLEKLDRSHKAVEAALSSDSVPHDGADLSQMLSDYNVAVGELPALINGYAANYNLLDPTIRAGLASADEVKKLDRIARAIESWKDFEIAYEFRTMDEGFLELIRRTKTFTKEKQREVLADRDGEIRDWYAMLNPVSDVAYDGIITGTDNLELRARTYTKPMMAAPNLSTSQLNCVGLAVYLACATREGAPFKTLVIDDPVQSMDDDHNEAFKKQVVGKLLDMGCHIVLLTHMQPLARDIESLYRNRGAALFKMRPYSRSGPSIEWMGPSINRLIENVKINKDAENEGYRKSATQDLRKFVEQFAKELFKIQTGQPISKRYEDKSWSELKHLLKRCKDFDPHDEPKLQDTHAFTSRHLHSDQRMPQDVASSSQLNSHYLAMRELLERYKEILGLAQERGASRGA